MRIDSNQHVSHWLWHKTRTSDIYVTGCDRVRGCQTYMPLGATANHHVRHLYHQDWQKDVNIVTETYTCLVRVLLFTDCPHICQINYNASYAPIPQIILNCTIVVCILVISRMFGIFIVLPTPPALGPLTPIFSEFSVYDTLLYPEFLTSRSEPPASDMSSNGLYASPLQTPSLRIQGVT